MPWLWLGEMGVKVVQQFRSSKMGGSGRRVRNIIVEPSKKFMTGNIAIKLLVKSLSLQKMGRGAGGSFRTFVLPPYSRHIFSPVEDCALPHTKTFAT